jgi:ribonucleotide reductase beta subunit family protein with ferritin-like domain
MSTEQDKFNHSKRLQKDENAIKKQVKIAKEHRVNEYNPGELQEPHRYHKHHAMDCGNPKCVMCSNPRKTFKELTQQEKRLFQDVDTPNDRHSNGFPPKDE